MNKWADEQRIKLMGKEDEQKNPSKLMKEWKNKWTKKRLNEFEKF